MPFVILSKYRTCFYVEVKKKESSVQPCKLILWGFLMYSFSIAV